MNGSSPSRHRANADGPRGPRSRSHRSNGSGTSDEDRGLVSVAVRREQPVGGTGGAEGVDDQSAERVASSSIVSTWPAERESAHRACAGGWRSPRCCVDAAHDLLDESGVLEATRDRRGDEQGRRVGWERPDRDLSQPRPRTPINSSSRWRPTMTSERTPPSSDEAAAGGRSGSRSTGPLITRPTGVTARIAGRSAHGTSTDRSSIPGKATLVARSPVRRPRRRRRSPRIAPSAARGPRGRRRRRSSVNAFRRSRTPAPRGWPSRARAGPPAVTSRLTLRTPIGSPQDHRSRLSRTSRRSRRRSDRATTWARRPRDRATSRSRGRWRERPPDRSRRR